MSQLRVTATVTNGDQTVTATGQAFNTDIAVGHRVTVVGSNAVYRVLSITDDNEFELNVAYAGSTSASADLVIHTSYTTSRNWPLLERGDIETAPIFGDFADGLDTALGAVPGAGEIPFADASGNLSSSSTFKRNSGGEVVNTLQPAFLAYKDAASTNATGNGTSVTVICNSEVFDQGADYNATTGIFTAPVTGRYAFEIAVKMTALSTAATYATIRLVASNRTFNIENGLNPKTGALETHLTAAMLVDMDAGDTAYVQASIQGMAGDTATVYGTGAPWTYFSGRLAC